jgi:hypothetical protein
MMKDVEQIAKVFIDDSEVNRFIDEKLDEGYEIKDFQMVSTRNIVHNFRYYIMLEREN